MNIEIFWLICRWLLITIMILYFIVAGFMIIMMSRDLYKDRYIMKEIKIINKRRRKEY